MKKVLSVALALVMMLAICVPAFAVELNKDNLEGSARVYTDTSLVGAGDFTVTFDAETPVMWGALTTALTYNVDAQLAAGKKLNVTVAADHDVMTIENGTDTLAYALSGADTNFTTDGAVYAGDRSVSVDVAQAAWDAAAIGAYADTVTFTASVVDA